MDRLKKLRRVTRTSITKISTKVEEELNIEEPDKQILLMLREEVIRLANTITAQDISIMDMLIDDEDLTEEMLNSEQDDIMSYRNKMTLAEIKINECLKTINGSGDSTISEAISHHTVVNPESRTKKTYKLPKIEIKKFNGQLLDWLSFWSQFEKIHEDKDLHDTDKFQYLSQAMVVGTRAKELVNSYPQTANNYPKVIAALKERFGKKKILKQVYVRELIKMITANVNGKNQIILSKLFDNLESHIRALESLGVTIEQTSEFLFPLVESSLPEEILIAWQRSPNFGKDGTKEIIPVTELDFLMQFLKQEVESEQQRNLARASFSSIKQGVQNNSNEKRNSNIPTVAGLHVGVTSSCIFCEKSHQSQDCIKAMNMTLEEKRKIIKIKKGCERCLRIHGTQRCKLSVNCSGCSHQHFHLMCPESPRNIEKKNNNCNSITKNSNLIIKHVLLKTIRIKVKSRFGSKIVRVLFDEGSQQSYIKTSVATELKCSENGKYFERNSVFGGVLTNIEERTLYKVRFTSIDGKKKHDLELPDKNKLTGEIVKIDQGPWLDELKSKGIYINDQESDNEEIDVLIGADLCPLLILDESITLKCGLKAVKTIFGWTVMGPVLVPHTQITLKHSMVVTLSLLADAKLKELWDLESLGICDPLTVNARTEKNLLAEIHFKETVSRANNGRYIVELPWIDGHQEIPNNFTIAEKRLYNATKKLKKDGVYATYDNIFKQWKDEGFIEKISIGDNLNARKNYHFIPHHPVFKPSSTTTPVRPVFDASCKMGRNPSLNECLEKGPNLIELIPVSMLRFRMGKYGVLSDIRKAFQMIEMQEQDQNYLLFLWWEDDTCTKLVTFKHKRVVFGLKSSPFILAAVINHHLDNVIESDKNIAKKLKSSLYVDNSVTSVDSEEEYHHFKDNSIRILAEAKMELRQWEHTSGIDCHNSKLASSSKEKQSAVLGMIWDKEEDTLACTAILETNKYLSKRTLLATINKIFDPLGFLSPAMIYPKLILQSTWNLKINWDEELPMELKERFEKWYKEIRYLENIKIPRKIKGEEFCEEVSNVQLHIFNDASQIAYATVIFLRVETRGEVSVQLVQTKAIILKLLPGVDNEIRTAQVKTADGVITRPLQRLFPLEISSVEKPYSITTKVKNRAKRLYVPDVKSKRMIIPENSLNGDSTSDEEEMGTFEKTTRYGRIIKQPSRLMY